MQEADKMIESLDFYELPRMTHYGDEVFRQEQSCGDIESRSKQYIQCELRNGHNGDHQNFIWGCPGGITPNHTWPIKFKINNLDAKCGYCSDYGGDYNGDYNARNYGRCPQCGRVADYE